MSRELSLILAAKQGDRDAAAALLAMHEGMLCQLARQYARGRDIMDDMMQAGRVGMLRAIRLFDPSRGVKFLTYAGKAAMSEMIVVGEKYDRAGKPDSEETNFHWMEAPTEHDDRDIDAAHRAVAKLPERERDILLSRCKGETRRGIGERMKMSGSRVRQIEQCAIGQVRRIMGLAAMVLVMVLTGCSAKARITEAAAQVQVKATSATQHIDAATATGDVGPKAQPHLDDAKEDIADISEAATTVQDALPDVVNKESPFWTWLKRFWYLAMAVMLAVLGVMYAPLRHLLNTIGSWFVSLIPRAIKVDAEADAELIANNEAGKVKATVKQVAAIELKKADPRYKKVLDKGLVAREVKKR